MRCRIILPLLLLCSFGQLSQARIGIVKQASSYAIIPLPVKIEQREGSFIFNEKTLVFNNGIVKDNESIEECLSLLRLATGKRLELADSNRNVISNFIKFDLIEAKELGTEGYELDVSPHQIVLKANNSAGLFYATQTLLQLLPVDVYSTEKKADTAFNVPCVFVSDTPRFSWRGMHLDVSRHFFPVKFIYTYIDMLAMHKMNVFHWHLTDDQGWRIEIKKYPKLTSVGAWRVDRENQNWNFRDPQRVGEKATYGGFYTQEEIKKIVEYAAERNITIVPEIEMPAHETAALAAYPQYSCSGGPFTVPPGSVWPDSDIFCAGNDKTFSFLENILSEVIDLFPGKYIHVGGDEADTRMWKRCPKCQARMKKEGLKDESQLQSYFIKRIEKFLVKKGKRLIGWDEILEGGIPPEATVMSWRGVDGGIAAARQNHDVVMTPGGYCYFDYYQGQPDIEPLAIGGYTPISKVYSYEPVPESLSAEQATHILGAQANVWSEYIPTPEHVQYMTMPRMAAMAEVLWSPKGARNWNDFSRRLATQLQRYKSAGYNYAKSMYLVSMATVPDTVKKTITVSMSTEVGVPEIHYTLDGTNPLIVTYQYDKPFTVNKTSDIRAASFNGYDILGNVTERKILLHKAVFAKIKFAYPYEKYGTMSTLTDGLRGSATIDDSSWVGFHQNDLDAIVDLGNDTTISTITAGFLQNTQSWIFYPTSVEFFAGKDTSNFVSVGSQTISVASKDEEKSVKDVSQSFKEMKARYVRVLAKNLGTCPVWHIGSGDKAWLFVDEIIIE